MATLTIELPDDLRRRIDVRAAEGGYARVEDYLRDFILVNTETDSGAEPISPELEARLLRALDTPLREMTGADWDEKRRALAEKFGAVEP
jgi:plasmid stability protein